MAFSRRVSLFPSTFGVDARERRRKTTYPLANSSRKKDRKWPLVLRFWKGSIHSAILFPVIVHSLLAALVVYINEHITSDFALPSTIIPSISIVLGLMLVFRNQTAFSRFWEGRSHWNTVTTAVRCLSRQFLALVPAPTIRPGLHSVVSSDSMLGTKNCSSKDAADDVVLSKTDEAKTIETVKILIAMLYTIKNHLRAEWGLALSPGTSLTSEGQQATSWEYLDLLPRGLKGYEHRGLGLTLELATFIEKFIGDGVKKGWFHNAASAAMLGELNALVAAYGSMEVIRLVPIPVAHLIHHKQTLALFCAILPFAMAVEMAWWAVPLVAFVSFTLYGIEGIAEMCEDPFGVDKIDINMDDIVEDTRREVEVLLTAWQTAGQGSGGIFLPKSHGQGLESSASSIHGDGDESEWRAMGNSVNTAVANTRNGSQIRFVISDLSEEGAHKDDEPMEIGGRGGRGMA